MGIYWADAAWAIVLIPQIALFAIALVQIHREARLSAPARFGWTIAVIVLPLLGLLAWFAFKPHRRDRAQAPASY